MNVARGRNVFSLLQKGFGARTAGTVPTSNFLGGFHYPTKREEGSSVGHVDISRRFLSIRARGGGRMKKVVGRQSTPTMEMAKAMPLSCREMNNSDLVMLGSVGNSDACKEILIRHIMSVDHVGYEAACDKFREIAVKNREGMWLLSLPYKIGISLAVGAAAASFPMVFDINTVSWFNELYVTADVPEPKDLETPLEVGSWAWAWMEPPLGQISFVLLCMQYTRAQIANIGIRPYTEKIMTRRAESLARAFPEYDSRVVMNFSQAISFYDDKHGIAIGKISG